MMLENVQTFILSFLENICSKWKKFVSEQFLILSKYIFLYLTLSQTSPGFYISAVQVFRKHCGKRRNCSEQAISPIPTVFSIHLENFLPFSSTLKLSSANSFNLEESKICPLGRGSLMLFTIQLRVLMTLGKILLKIVWEKEKKTGYFIIAGTSNQSIGHPETLCCCCE